MADTAANGRAHRFGARSMSSLPLYFVSTIMRGVSVGSRIHFEQRLEVEREEIRRRETLRRASCLAVVTQGCRARARSNPRWTTHGADEACGNGVPDWVIRAQVGHVSPTMMAVYGGPLSWHRAPDTKRIQTQRNRQARLFCPVPVAVGLPGSRGGPVQLRLSSVRSCMT